MFDLFARYFDRWFNRPRYVAGLNFKLLLIICVVSLIGVLATSSLLLTLQRQQLVESALQSTTRLSNAVESSLEQAMLKNDREMINQIVRTMVDKQSIEQIHILDAVGLVHTSSSPDELGKRYDYSYPTCKFCHENGERSNNQTTILTERGNHESLVNVNLIDNQPQCQGCHDPQTKILGITIIEMPLTDLNNQVAAGFWRIALASVITLGLLIVLMTFALRKLIITPVGELTRGMTEIRSGNLDYHLRVQSRDELGDLADSFDMMRKQLLSSRAENAKLYKKMRSLAILEERDRLAREMHDNLAQMLGYLNIKASLTDDQLAKNQIAEARASLKELKQIGKDAYIDVREAIFNLRLTMSGRSGLVPLLEDFLIEYRGQSGIDARLMVEDVRLTRFPAEVEVQVNRIIQEALTNTRKHSGAKQAWVCFRQEDHTVEISIEDDGKGFDPNRLPNNGSKHFGLQIMRERAESVSGEFEINSHYGSGTRITIHIPMWPVIEDLYEDASDFVG